MVDLLWSALSVNGAFRVRTVRAVRVADLLQGDGELLYEGTAPFSDLPWVNTDFELQHCEVAVRRREFPLEVAYAITRSATARSATSWWTCGRSRCSTGGCAW